MCDMTLDEFFKALAAVPHRWKIRYGRLIRTADICPVAAVCNTKIPGASEVDDWESAGAKLGLEDDLAEKLQSAADASPRYSKRLRAKLLAACKLTETA